MAETALFAPALILGKSFEKSMMNWYFVRAKAVVIPSWVSQGAIATSNSIDTLIEAPRRLVTALYQNRRGLISQATVTVTRL